jgi:hypothetical protein
MQKFGMVVLMLIGASFIVGGAYNLGGGAALSLAFGIMMFSCVLVGAICAAVRKSAEAGERHIIERVEPVL